MPRWRMGGLGAAWDMPGNKTRTRIHRRVHSFITFGLVDIVSRTVKLVEIGAGGPGIWCNIVNIYKENALK